MSLLMPQFAGRKRRKTVVSSASVWAGATGSFTLTSPDIVGSSNNTALRSSSALSGDFWFELTFTAAGGTDGIVIGAFDVDELGTFSDSNAAGGMASMTESFYHLFTSRVNYHGSTPDASEAEALGSVMKIERVGSTWKLYDDGVLIHTWAATFSGPVYLCVGTGSSMTLSDVSWNN